ncbi:MAG: HNH endonuclease [Candidatus Omnitrophica bacterium]|nr:HNH endonuclease [Candidatus Omnitrophota bacterium]
MHKKCTLCGSEIIKENDSEEHVIPQAIGGRLTVKGFICKGCNGKSGQEWDAVLAKQLNPLSLFFGIKRERGQAPSQKFPTSTGGEFEHHTDGSLSLVKPEFHVRKVDGKTEIKIVARSDKELNRLLKGLKKKYPQVNIGDLKAKATHETIHPDGFFHYKLNAGGEKAGRSLVKTAIAFAYSMGIPISHYADALRYLKENKCNPPFGYYSQDVLIKRPIGIPLHCVAIIGDPEVKLLLCYIEYFCFERVVICLSEQYEGEKISKLHALDPVSGESIDIGIDFPIKDLKVKDLYEYKLFSPQMVEEALGNVIGPRLKIKQDQERNEVIDRAINTAIKNSGCKPGEPFTAEHIKKMADNIAAQMLPYIIHIRTRK